MNDSRYTRAYANANITTAGNGVMKAGRICRALNTFNIDLPSALKTPLPGNGILNGHITHLLTDIPTRDYLAEAAELIEAGKDPDELLALHAGQQLRVGAAAYVANKRSDAWVQNFADNADNIIKALRTEVFEPLIARVTEAVETYGDNLDMDQAVKDRDFTRAQVLADMHDGFGIMAEIHAIRQTLHHDKLTGSAAWLIEPTELKGDPTSSFGAKTPDIAQALWWADKIRSGLTPIFPTYAEYLDLINSDEYKAHAEEIAGRDKVFSNSILHGGQVKKADDLGFTE